MEVNLYRVLLILIITTHASGAYSKPRHKVQTSNEEKVARYIIQFFKKNNRKEKSFIHSQLIKLTPKSSLFNNLITPLKDIKQIDNARYFKNISDLCSRNMSLSTEYNDFVTEGFKRIIIETCYKKATNDLNKNKPQAKEFIIKNLKRINSFLPKERVESLFNNFKKSDLATYNHLIGKAKQMLIENEFYNVDKMLWKYLPEDNKTTTLINELYSYNKHEKIYFEKEFLLQYKNLKKELKKNNYKKLTESVEQAFAFYNQNKEFLKKEKVVKKFIYIGKQLLGQKNYSLAKKVFLLSTYVDKNNSPSFFYLIFCDLLKQDLASALSTIENYQLVEKFSRLSTRLKFWIAIVYEKKSEEGLAKYLYKKIARKSPLTYYGVLSLIKLSKHNSRDAKTTFNITFTDKNYKSFGKITKTKELNRHLKRLQIWASLEQISYTKKEMRDIFKKDLTKMYTSSKTIHPKKIKQALFDDLLSVFSKKNDFLNLFSLTFRKIRTLDKAIHKESLEQLFPMAYYGHVLKYSKNLNPLIIQSLIRQESAFNPKAISRVGARGLMQLMPKTAKSLGKNIKISQLKLPKKNIELGVKYLKDLMKRFDGNLIYSLAAYNAGPTSVNRWIKNDFKESLDNPLFTVELIPYAETNQYVKLILRNLFYYEMLSKGFKFNPEIKELSTLAKN